MLSNNDLHSALRSTSSRHDALVKKFNEFDRLVEATVTPEQFSIPNIEFERELAARNGFALTFAGRKIYFIFRSGITSPNTTVRGHVDCYLSPDFPREEVDHLGGFSFKPNGETDMQDPETEDQLFLDWDESALHISLHFIHESLLLDVER